MAKSCIAAKRIIVVDAIYDEFVRRVEEKIQNLNYGDPKEPGIDIGPMARNDLRLELHDQVERSVRAGAQLRLGGFIPSGKGFYYPPTLLIDVVPGMPAFDEELFGPVVSITRTQDEKRAITLANQSVFGLGAAVFTNDIHRGEQIATYELNAGSCTVNGLVRSDPRLPFGGIGQSGYGRELSRDGIREFVNIKTVQIF